MITNSPECQVLILCQLYNHGGYSEIALNLANIAQNSSHICRLIDVSSTVDENKKNQLNRFELINNNSIITENTIVLLADIPERLRCLRVSAFKNVISYSCFETSSIPETWNRCLDIADIIWSCSSFNALTYKTLGLKKNINILPLPFNKEYVSRTLKPIKGKIRILYNCSFHLRKDIDQCIYSFVETFSGIEDVELVISAFGIKSGGSSFSFSTNEEFTSYLYLRAQLLTNKSLKEIPDIQGWYGYASESELLKRYEDSHIYFSTERGNGWAIPVMNSIVNGIVPVCINWGASTEYLKDLDRYLIKVTSLEAVFPKLQERTAWYQGQEWAALDIACIKICLLNAYNDVKNGNISKDLLNIRNQIVNDFSFENILATFDSMITRVAKQAGKISNGNLNIAPESIFKQNPISLDNKGWCYSQLRKICSNTSSTLTFNLSQSSLSLAEVNSKNFPGKQVFTNESLENIDYWIDKDFNIINSQNKCVSPSLLKSPHINHCLDYNVLAGTCFVLSSGVTPEVAKLLQLHSDVDIFWLGSITDIPGSLLAFKSRVKKVDSFFELYDKYNQVIVLDCDYITARVSYEKIIWIDFLKPVLFFYNKQYFNSQLIELCKRLKNRNELLQHIRRYSKFKYSCPIFCDDTRISKLCVANRFDLESDLAEFILRSDHFLQFADSIDICLTSSIQLPITISNFNFLSNYQNPNKLDKINTVSNFNLNSSHEFNIKTRAISSSTLYLVTDFDRLDMTTLKNLILTPNKLILDTSDFEMRSGFVWTYIEYYCMTNQERSLMYSESIQTFETSLHSRNSPLKGDVTIYATGPSLSSAYSADFQPKGLSIICNTIVKDTDLLDKLRPKYCCAMDSDFHWGASLYCSSFRRDLINCIKKFDTYLIVPFACLPLVRRLLGDIKSNIIGVQVTDRPINIDLKKSLSVKAVDNVLNVILFPLAASVGDHIYLLGFDGRGKTDSKFWSHNKRTQYSELMQSIEFCHPGFFICRDYSKYSSGQSTNTEKYISYIESKSLKVTSLAPSNVTSINDRYEP